MRDKLRLEDSFIQSIGEIVVERVPFGPKTKYREEALVRFKSVEARDVVRGAVVNLAGWGQEVGIRLEIPNRLKANMKPSRRCLTRLSKSIPLHEEISSSTTKIRTS